MRENCFLTKETASKHERLVKEAFRLFHSEGQATAGERRQVRVRVSNRSENKRLRFHGLRAQVKIQLSCYEMSLEYVED
jgi:hypothetical protein